MLNYDASRLHRSQPTLGTIDYHEWRASSTAHDERVPVAQLQQYKNAASEISVESLPATAVALPSNRSHKSQESPEVWSVQEAEDRFYSTYSSGFSGGVAKSHLVTRHSSADFLGRYYEQVKPIGKGAFGSVHLVCDRSTGSQRVSKEINFADGVCDKPEKLLELTRQELQLLCDLDHPHIVKLFECCEDMEARRSVLIMEHIDGGDCYCLLAKTLQGLQEPLVCSIMQQTFVALGYCHGKGVLHRDVKSANILLKKTPVWGCPLCMLVDFGLAARSQNAGEAVCTRGEYVGTPSYFSPEVVASKYYSPKSDVWAAGILAIELLTGALAFGRAKDHQGDVRLLFRSIGSFRSLQDFNSRLGSINGWKERSDTASKLFQKLLEVDPDKRLRARDAANDPWCNLHGTAFGLTSQIVQSLANYADAPPPVRCCLLAIAVRSSVPDQYHLAAAFKDADVDGDGLISQEDLSTALERSTNWWDPELDTNALVELADLDRSGGLSYSEFVAACIFDFEGSIEKLANDAFTALDTDRDERIVVREVRALFPELDAFVLQKYARDRELTRAEWSRSLVASCKALGGALPGQGTVLCGGDILQCGQIGSNKPPLHNDPFGMSCGSELLQCAQVNPDLNCEGSPTVQGCDGQSRERSDSESENPPEEVRPERRLKKGKIDCWGFSCAGDD